MLEGTFTIEKRVSDKTGKTYTVIILHCGDKDYFCFDQKTMSQIIIDNL